MGNPIILLIDHDVTHLGVLEDGIRRRYGADYEILIERSGPAALEKVQQLVSAGEPLALVMATQWMPSITGIEVLAKVRDIDWRAKRVLMIDLGDRGVQELVPPAISLGQIDAYLERPWGQLEFRFYPLIGDLLSERAKIDRSEAAWIRVVGDRMSPRIAEARDLLSRNGVPFEFYEATSETGKRLLEEGGLNGTTLPIFILFDGQIMVNPSNAEVATALGVQTRPKAGLYDVAIIGGGPAGLAAAVYGASEGLRVVVIEPEASGGQAGTTSLIRNYLGFPRGISGTELTRRAWEQAFLFGAEFIFMNRAVAISRRNELRVVTLTSGDEVVALSVVIACGVAYRRLGVQNVERLQGRGVYYGAAVTEAPAMTGQQVFIVGGANSAGQAAVYLSKYAKDVTMVVRGPGLGSTMSEYLLKEIERTKNIHICPNAEVVDAYGEHRLEGLLLRDRVKGSSERVAAGGLFLMIGANPRTEWLEGMIDRDARGFILTGSDLVREGRSPEGWPMERPPLLFETSVPGVFAAGDVRHGSVPRVASAVGAGAIAIMLVHQYLADQRIDTGLLLTEQGAPGDKLYLVLDGELSVEVDGAVVAQVGPGTLVGERAILEGGSRTASLRAATPVRVAVLHADQVERARLAAIARDHAQEGPSRRARQ